MRTFIGRCNSIDPERVSALPAAAVSANSTNALPRPLPVNQGRGITPCHLCC